MLSIIAAFVLIGTIYDLYKVGKSWFSSLSHDNDMSGAVFNDYHHHHHHEESRIVNDDERHSIKGKSQFL